MPDDTLTDEFRRRWVERLVATAAIRSPAVADAFLAAPRDAFVRSFLVSKPGGWRAVVHDPAAPDRDVLRQVYTDDALVTHVGPDGAATSSTSQPSLVAKMLETLRLAPGMRVLEIGVGTGWNAALLAAIVGPRGTVASVDIQPDVVAEARALLDAAGFGRVAVRCGDGADGWPELAPFDRIVATVGCPDVPEAWAGQLVGGGEVLVPLQHAGVHPLTLLRRDGDRLTGRVVGSAGFVPLRGSLGGAEPWPAVRPRRPGSGERSGPPLPALHGAAEFETWWDAAYTVGLLDRRAVLAGRQLALTQGRSAAVAGPDGVRAWGDAALLGDLRSHVERWEGWGRPAMGDWLSTFQRGSPVNPRPPPPPGSQAEAGSQPRRGAGGEPDSRAGEVVLVVRRHTSTQTVRLAPPAVGTAAQTPL